MVFVWSDFSDFETFLMQISIFGEMCVRDVVKTLWEALGSLREAGEAFGGIGEPKKLYDKKA